MQALSDESIPLELGMKPFLTFDEGRAALHELTSTQTMITSLIKNNSSELQTEAVKELTTCVKKYEDVLVKLKNTEDNSVSLRTIINYSCIYILIILYVDILCFYLLIYNFCRKNYLI